MHIFNRLNDLPYFNPDLVEDDFIVPGSVLGFRKQIEEADGVINLFPKNKNY